MIRRWLTAVWVVGMLGFAGGGFFLAREAAAAGALDKAKVALAEQGITQPRTSISNGSLVIEGGAADTPAHLAAVIAVRQQYPKRHIVDKIRVADTTPPPGSPEPTIDPIVDVPTSLELGS
jgi:hypothetical protein